MPDQEEEEVILVSGGAGSIGSSLVNALCQKKNAKTVRVYDIDEYGLSMLSRRVKSSKLRAIRGDVNDYDPFRRAGEECTSLFHLAAMKSLAITEYNVMELIRVNLGGASNAVKAALDNRIARTVFVSSDKSVDFSSSYGKTKSLGEDLFSWANRIAAPRSLFSSVRFPNTIETRGNVFEIWRSQLDSGEKITLTDPEMERYIWHIDEAVGFMIKAWEMMQGGEIFIPKAVDVWKMGQVAKLYGSKEMTEIIGSRDREVLKGRLFTEEESRRLEEKDGLYILRA